MSTQDLWARLGRLAYGADYNPEQWDEPTWAEDVKLMHQAGVNLVSLGIFSWASLQPAPGKFEGSWLDKVLDLLGENGISVCLATATASPPPWLVEAHPEVLPVDEAGHRLWHGSRQHFCPSSEAFKDATAELVGWLADRYGGHPALAAWHVGNEYGCHVARCYCDVSAEGFRSWLQARYGDLDSLNEAWWTTFWSQRYTSWSQVFPPRKAPTFPNPSQQLDFFRFSNDALRACYDNEARILRQKAPHVPVTTNFLPFWEPVDAFSWAGGVDIASLDSYPDPADPDAASKAALSFGLMRGLSGGRPWLLMEQAPSAVNWRSVNRPKSPALYKLWTWQAIAHGANGALCFQWRASRGGAEKWHSAMVPHGGTDDPVYRQVVEVGDELARRPEIAQTHPPQPEVAILFDWPNWWALGLPSRPSSQLDLLSLVGTYHSSLWRNGLTADVVPVTADLARYRLVVVPNLYLTEHATALRLATFVNNGGHVLVGFFSGLVGASDVVHEGAYPGALRQLLGVEVDQFWPLGSNEQVEVALPWGRAGKGSLWSEELRALDATVEAKFAGGVLAGRPALTAASRGAGKAWYVATLLDPDNLDLLLAKICKAAGVEPVLPNLPRGVEVLRRSGQNTDLLFLLNHSPQPARLELPTAWGQFLGPPVRDGQFELGAMEVAVLSRLTTQKGGNNEKDSSQS